MIAENFLMSREDRDGHLNWLKMSFTDFMALPISSCGIRVGGNGDWLIWTPTSKFSAHQSSLQEKHQICSLRLLLLRISLPIPLSRLVVNHQRKYFFILFLILTQSLITWFIIFIRLSYWHFSLFINLIRPYSEHLLCAEPQSPFENGLFSIPWV